MTELKEICKVLCGFAFDSKKFTEDDSFSPLIRIRDVKRGFTQTYYTGEFSSEYIVHKGDLLVGMDGEFNIARWNSEDALLNQRVCRIIANSKVNEEYLRFYLKRTLKLIESKTSFVTVKHLSAKELNGLKLNLPCMEDQQRISKQLSILELVIRKNKKVLELFDELVKARFVEMFGTVYDKKFDMKTLPDIVSNDKNSIKRGPFGGALKKDDFLKEGYLVYEQRHAIHEDFEYAKYYISKEKYESMIGFKVIPGDLIISCSGVTLGRIAEVPNDAKEGIINQALLKISLNKDIMNNKFFIYQFRCKEIQEMLFGFSRGSGIPNMPSMKEVKAFKFICPPLELQNQFASFVKEIDKSRSRIQKSLEASQELFDSLMQEYFG